MILFFLGLLLGVLIGDAILFLQLRSSLMYIPFVSYAYHFVEISKRLKEKRKGG